MLEARGSERSQITIDSQTPVSKLADEKIGNPVSVEVCVKRGGMADLDVDRLSSCAGSKWRLEPRRRVEA